jgi:hypothetical protein
MPDFSSLESELLALGADLRVEAPGGDLVTTVLDRVAVEPLPAPPSVWVRLGRWLRERWRRIVAVFAAFVIVGALAPPVRASVGELFGFSGVIVNRAPGPGPSTAPPPPTAGPMTLDQARGLIAFAPRLPSSLGPPTGVEVSADRQILSLTWSGRGTGVIRLDEFNGGLDPYFWKTVHEAVQPVTVGPRDGMWFRAAHEVVVLDSQGTERRLPPRIAGPTLVWDLDGTAIRLEGATSLSEALSIGSSIS